MRIGWIYSNTIFASWSNLAVVEFLREQGHEVVPVPMHYAEARHSGPPFEVLQSCDVVGVLGCEYLYPWIFEVYGEARWMTLKNRVGVFVESATRSDKSFDFAGMLKYGTINFFPNMQDAITLGGHYLRGSVDTRMFAKLNVPKVHDVGFIGNLYDRRARFFSALSPCLHGLTCEVRSILRYDSQGNEMQRVWAESVVEAINMMKIHLCAPSNNDKMMVARPFETMACGTFCLTYRTDDNPFIDRVHYVSYDPDDIPGLSKIIRYYLKHDEEREGIARAGQAVVVGEWSTWQRVAEMMNIIRGECK